MDQKMNRLADGLSELNLRIQFGAQFPDASYIVAWLFKICHHDLADAYDAQFRSGQS